ITALGERNRGGKRKNEPAEQADVDCFHVQLLSRSKDRSIDVRSGNARFDVDDQRGQSKVVGSALPAHAHRLMSRQYQVGSATTERQRKHADNRLTDVSLTDSRLTVTERSRDCVRMPCTRLAYPRC